MKRGLRVSIINQSEIQREGLRRVLLDHSFEVGDVCHDHLQLDLDMVSADPEVMAMVIVDQPTDQESLDTCRYVHERWPDCKIVVLASDCQSRTVADAFHAGIDGYVGKHISCDSFMEMLKLVALGEKMVPSQVVHDLAALVSDRQWRDVKIEIGESNLSDREVDILQGLIRGEPNKIISRQLSITEATVKVHVKSILRKLGVMNRTQAAIWGNSRGLKGNLEAPTLTAPARTRSTANGQAAYSTRSRSDCIA